MREELTMGTRAASFTRPMRRPRTSSTGMETSSVKNSRFSASGNVPIRNQYGASVREPARGKGKGDRRICQTGKMRLTPFSSRRQPPHSFLPHPHQRHADQNERSGQAYPDAGHAPPEPEAQNVAYRQADQPVAGQVGQHGAARVA